MSSTLPHRLDVLLTRINPSFGERVRTDAEACERVAADASGLPPGEPAAVVEPVNTEDVVLLAREAAELGVPLVPRGAGTGKAGACIPSAGQVVVDFRRLRGVRALRPRDLYAVVAPGLVTLELEQAAREVGLMYPPDPGYRHVSTIGGNIATNAGGPRALKYGVTQRYVWGLEVVLPGGDVVHLGRRALKGVAGYDLTSLFVGSEGTLGMVTEATMHLVPAPEAVETAWIDFPDVPTAAAAAAAVLTHGGWPAMLELLDTEALNAVRPKAAALSIDATAGASVLVEADGDERAAHEQISRMVELFGEHGASRARVAAGAQEREAMRDARRMVSGALKERYPWKLSDDVVAPRSQMPELMRRARDLAATYGVRLGAYGHLGDGNLHVNFLCVDEHERQRARTLRPEVLALAVGMGGTITGEHGVGLTKRDQLDLEQSAELLALQRRVKQAFDPSGILNPNKVVPSGPLSLT